jgi:predicted DNA-binding protein
MPNDPDTSAVYVNKRGLTNRITSFRCNVILRNRLFDYAREMNRDPSSIIREAIGEYLHKRSNKIGVNNVESANNIVSQWSARSTKL